MRTSYLLVLALLLSLAAFMHAQAADPVRDFAARVATAAGPGAANLTTINTSPLNAEQFAAFRKALQQHLQEAGLRLRQPQNAINIRVTVGENVRGVVYLAEVQQGSEVRHVIAEGGRVAGASTAATALSLRRTLLVSRAEPILDAAEVRSGSETKLLLLTAQSVVLYRQRNGAWSEEASVALTHANNFPLDVRGHLQPLGERPQLEAYLPGTVCTLDAADALRVECREGDDPWPLGAQAAFFNSSANYFNGLLRPGMGKQMAPFFSAATLGNGNAGAWIFAGVDGQVRVQDGQREDLLNVRDWGSDLAAVRSGCGAGTQLLVSTQGAAGGNDALRAVEFSGRQPVTAAPEMELPGAITALWSAADGASAVAVVRNARAESYEAYRVAVGCR